MYSDNDKKYTVTFSLVNDREYRLIINAIKRQVDYYTNRVIDSENTMNEKALISCKYNLKVYKDLYNKIISDYDNVVKCNG